LNKLCPVPRVVNLLVEEPTGCRFSAGERSDAGNVLAELEGRLSNPQACVGDLLLLVEEVIRLGK
jgi:hypothetical protein